MNRKEEVFRCPYCKSKKTIWIGYRRNISGNKRIRRCKSCSRKFTPKDIFQRARFHRSHVIEATALYCGGLSLERVRALMLQHRNINVSRTSILKWSRKYSGIVEELASRLKSLIRGVEHSEDIYFEMIGNRIHYSGVMDSKVIFKVSSRLNIDDIKKY